jgi:hypothetical protein
MGMGEKQMSEIKYLRIVADEKGCSHFEKQRVGLASHDYAPPAPALNTSAPQPAEKAVFLELPVGWYGDWHPTPVRQWLILMTGECEFEAGDGERALCRAGDVILLDDTTGPGHRTLVIGASPVRIAAIHLA